MFNREDSSALPYMSDDRVGNWLFACWDERKSLSLAKSPACWGIICAARYGLWPGLYPCWRCCCSDKLNCSMARAFS